MPHKPKKRRMRQLHLGRTMYGNELTVLGLTTKRATREHEGDPGSLSLLPFNDYSSRELYNLLVPPFRVLDLPEEIVDEIIIQAALGPPRKPYENYRKPVHNYRATASSLMLVCKIFYRLAAPHLYSEVLLSASPTKIAFFEIQDLQLFQSLSQCPHVARYCTDLQFYMEDRYLGREAGSACCRPHDEHSTFDKTFCVWTNLRSTLAHMSQLRGLHFYLNTGNSSSSMCTKSLCEILTPYQHLRKLHLTFPRLCCKCPQDLQGSTTVTSLNLKHLKAIEGLAELLEWPAKLERFRLNSDSIQEQDIDVDYLRSALLRQRDCLKSLTIKGYTLRRPIVVRDFPSLETINLSIPSMTGWDPNEVCFNILSAPRLRKFTWDFFNVDELTDFHNVCHCGFGKQDIDWLTDVVTSGPYQARALREVEVVLQEGFYSCCMGRNQLEVAGRFRDLENILHSQGVDLKQTPRREWWSDGY